MEFEQSSYSEGVSAHVIDGLEAIDGCIRRAEGLEVAYCKEYPHQSPPGVPVDDLPIGPKLKRYLTEAYPEGLFTHQHAALKHILSGRNVVVNTRTSSGTTLIFTLPAFEDFIEDRSATSLFVYPQKALANDQLLKLQEIGRSICAGSTEELLISRYDGATPADQRPAIRERGQFILTNPDMLHRALLQYHKKWARFFGNLRYVILDEAHVYHGVFGTSLAYILRRLRCVCRRYGSSPRFISTSATIHQPENHLRMLTGLPFLEIGPDLDGSLQGRKRLCLLRSKMHHYQTGRQLTRLFVNQGLSCLTFCPSRVSAERLVADFCNSDLSDSRIRVYRAGLSTDEREEIEAGMKNGRIRGVFSTSALELGIDIGALDVAICVGISSTMMSLWQRAGRVGRGGKEGGIVFIAADTPLDTYFSEHPDELFERANEPLAVNLQNRRLLCHHLACSIQEMGDEDSVDTEIMGDSFAHALELRRTGRLTEEVFYSDDPHMRTPVRNTEARNYKLMVGAKEIGEIDPWHLIREAYPHGIYLHGGRRYRVTDIFKSSSEIRLIAERSRNLTDPRIHKKVHTRSVRALMKYQEILIKMAYFEVAERLVAVFERNPNGDIVRQYSGDQGLAPHRLPTEGISIELTPNLCTGINAQIRASNRLSVVHAVERLIRGLFPVISGPCDTMDFDAFSEVSSGRVCWYLYDRVHDGIDLTVRAYRRVPELLAKAADRLHSCTCPEDLGCFRCIRNPDEEEVTSKSDCIRVLSHLSQELLAEPTEEVFDVDGLDVKEVVRRCPEPKCNAPIGTGDNFCKKCGTYLGE